MSTRASPAAGLFHPSVQEWFERTYARPTAVQAKSWPLIADKQHLLITAPTGSGKTLTAFLSALNRFATGEWTPGHTRVLYVSPLKALNNDIRRNLLEPLNALQANPGFPSVNVQTRSGDTSQTDRQRMLRQPPEILITTPESLFLLLTNRKGRQALGTVETVILDEIHSIVDNRRGVQLMTSLERLVDLAGEFQRLALSATIRPLDAVAGYVAGRDAGGNTRRIEIVDTDEVKHIRFRVRFPEDAKHAAQNGQPIWDPLAVAFRRHIDANTATLFFTNSRRLAEKITLKINEGEPAHLAYAHHGSLAREIRTTVEERLKAGELKAIVATNSLEMGIDIGHLDEVVMVQSPASVASALQRIGRAGHRVGETSTGTLYPTHAQDFLEAAVLAEQIAARDIEPLDLMRNALDVLAQVIVSCCAQDAWHVDRLFALLTRSAPYHELPRAHFDLLLDMLAGRYAGSRVRELKPRLSYDRIEQTVKAQKSALFALYNSGGTIPDRGYYKLRHAESGALIGELDEEFVWEAKVGQTFAFGTQGWQIQRITHNDVLARQAPAGSRPPPFWRSETFNRSFHFSEHITRYLESANAQLEARDAAVLKRNLEEERGFDTGAAEELVDYLERQREATGTDLPHRHHVLLEQVSAGPGGYRGPNEISELVIHNFWGGRLNRPWALALEAAWRRNFSSEPEIHADNNAIAIQLPERVEPAQLLALVTPENLQALLRESLENSGFFGARFRECAGRALLLTRQRFNERLPLWMSRLQAKKLMTAVKPYTDFPILLESWRTCLEDEFDLPALERMLGELTDGHIRWTYVTTSAPSPFAANLTSGSVNRYMYADDTPQRSNRSSLSDELISNALANADLRPKLDPATIAAFLARRQRTLPGYQPQTAQDWEDWLKERVVLPEGELPEETLPEFRRCWIGAGDKRWLVHPELLAGLVSSGLLDGITVPADPPDVTDPRTARQFAGEILSFYGPLSLTEIKEILPTLPAGLLDDASAPDDTSMVSGVLVEGREEACYCNSENLEILLRFQRSRNRPEVTPRKAETLPAFLAAWQRFGRGASEDSIIDALLCLRGYPAPVDTWLAEFMSARMTDFSDYQLDQAVAAGELCWYGVDRETVSFGYPEDPDLLAGPDTASPVAALFTDPHARYGFLQLADRQQESLESFNGTFWDAVWQGELVCDSLASLREGATGKYQLLQMPSRTHSARSARRASSRLGSGWGGNWSLRAPAAQAEDALMELEDNKDRARLLLDRYGFACRELANREGRSMRWAAICKALFSMELAGEIVAGYFFEGLSGPQFMTPAGLNTFLNTRSDLSFWVNAVDPVSPCGLGVDDPRLPARRPGNYLSYHEGELALVVENAGHRLSFHLPHDHPAVDGVCAPLMHIVRTRKRFPVDTINGLAPASSPYLAVLSRVFTPVRDHRRVFFERR